MGRACYGALAAPTALPDGRALMITQNGQKQMVPTMTVLNALTAERAQQLINTPPGK